MLDLILTVLFGWAGYWKFKNGKIGLGIVWLLTFGAFGFGWLFDIIFALVACLNNAKATQKQPTAPVNALPSKPVRAQTAAPSAIAQPVTPQRSATPVPPSAPRPAPQPVQQPAAPVPVPSPQQTENESDILQYIEDAIKSEPPVQVKIKMTSKVIDNSNEQIPELSRLDFGKPAGSVGRFLNYGRYKVFGTRDNGRKSFLIRTGRTPECAANKIEASELSPPYEPVEITPEPPSERQIALLVRHGTAYPPELTSDDAGAMIDRICDEDRRDGPEPWLVALADGIGIEFSAFVGGAQLFDLIFWQIGARDRAALYAYAVQQSLAGQPFGNMLTDPAYDRFYAFADVVAVDSSLVKSLEGREPSDYLKPQRGTKIFKAAAAFLVGGAP